MEKYNDEKDFLENYLTPSVENLNKVFTYPLPNIEGLANAGNIIIQGELEDTYSTNIITKYRSESLDVNLIEVYKCTQNKKTGNFVRLVGSGSILKNGYPPLLIDAPILNLDFLTGKSADLQSRMIFNFPLANDTQQKVFFSSLVDKAAQEGITIEQTDTTGHLPSFWGKMLRCKWDGVDLKMMQKLRDHAWNCYEGLVGSEAPVIPFDYQPVHDFLVFEQAEREHYLFKKFGLSVPVEVQGAFFRSMLASPLEQSAS